MPRALHDGPHKQVRPFLETSKPRSLFPETCQQSQDPDLPFVVFFLHNSLSRFQEPENQRNPRETGNYFDRLLLWQTPETTTIIAIQNVRYIYSVHYHQTLKYIFTQQVDHVLYSKIKMYCIVKSEISLKSMATIVGTQ